MRVNLTANVPNATAEISAKAPESTSAEDENSFLSQIGSVLNQNQAHGEVQTESKVSVKGKSRNGDNASTASQGEGLSAPPSVSPEKMPSLSTMGMAVMEEAPQSSSDTGIAGNPVKADMSGDLPIVIAWDYGAVALNDGNSEAALKDAISPGAGSGPCAGKIRGSFADAVNAIQLKLKMGVEDFAAVAGLQVSGIAELQGTGNPSKSPAQAIEGNSLQNAFPSEANSGSASEMSTITMAAKTTRIMPDGPQLDFVFPRADGTESGGDKVSTQQAAPESSVRSASESNKLTIDVKAPVEAFNGALSKNSEKMLEITVGISEAGKMAGDPVQLPDRSSLEMAFQSKPDGGEPLLRNPQTRSSEGSSHAQTAFVSTGMRYAESGAPANVAPSSAPGSPAPELVFRLAEQIRIQLRDGKGEIRIQLKPENLGRLEIRAENTINGIMARITTESSTVKTYLENNLQLLQQTLQNQDLRVDRIHVIVQDALDAQSSPGYPAQSGHAGSGQHGKDSSAHAHPGNPAGLEMLNETSLDPVSWLALNPSNRFYTVA